MRQQTIRVAKFSSILHFRANLLRGSCFERLEQEPVQLRGNTGFQSSSPQWN